MIPQRNLSVLANRLAKEGGRRIPESVLERDYYLAWFLAELAVSDLKAMRFKHSCEGLSTMIGGMKTSWVGIVRPGGQARKTNGHLLRLSFARPPSQTKISY